MSARAQISFTILVEDNRRVQAIVQRIETALENANVIIQGNSVADLSEEYDIIGVDNQGNPWEATIRAATEADAVAAVPANVTIAKIQRVSIFAAGPTGGS